MLNSGTRALWVPVDLSTKGASFFFFSRGNSGFLKVQIFHQQKRPKKHRSLTGWRGLIEHASKNSASSSRKRHEVPTVHKLVSFILNQPVFPLITGFRNVFFVFLQVPVFLCGSKLMFCWFYGVFLVIFCSRTARVRQNSRRVQCRGQALDIVS